MKCLDEEEKCEDVDNAKKAIDSLDEVIEDFCKWRGESLEGFSLINTSKAIMCSFSVFMLTVIVPN